MCKHVTRQVVYDVESPPTHLTRKFFNTSQLLLISMAVLITSMDVLVLFQMSFFSEYLSTNVAGEWINTYVGVHVNCQIFLLCASEGALGAGVLVFAGCVLTTNVGFQVTILTEFLTTK